jgi:hypothetical protein
VNTFLVRILSGQITKTLVEMLVNKVRFPINTLSRSEAKKLKKVRETKQRRVSKRLIKDEMGKSWK